MSPRLPEALEVAVFVIDALDRLGVDYHVGGSFASSVHGVPRQTNDVDLVVDLPAATVPRLAATLRQAFYLDEDRILEAVRRRSSCNLLHLASGIKVDLFVAGSAPFDRLELERSVCATLPGAERPVRVKSPEDTVLRKLAWYRLGNEVSDRQWGDLRGLVSVRADDLDHEYLRRWSVELGVDDLLDRLLHDG